MNGIPQLDPVLLLEHAAERIPSALRRNVVVIGSIAAAWAFRDLSGTHTVATKDIDLLLRPDVNAVATAEALGQRLLDEGWQPQYPNGIEPATEATPDDLLPALRLSPPGGDSQWFVELLAEPSRDQVARKHWRRFHTDHGDFGLPSFRYLRVAVHGATETDTGLYVARPARMALAHLLEHAEPDTMPIAGIPGTPPRFTKDVGRAVSLWWLARQQSPLADTHWLNEWKDTLDALYCGNTLSMKAAARTGLSSIGDYLREAHGIALNGVLAPHATRLDAFQRAYDDLHALINRIE